MNRLIKIEYLKNLSYKPFKILSIIYFLCLIALLFIGLVNFSVIEIEFNLKDQGFYDFPAIWHFTTYIVAIFKIFLGLIIILSISQEFSNRTYKQNLIDGLSKKEFITSKVLAISLFTLISTLIVFLTSLFIGLFYAKDTKVSLIFEEIFFVGNYALKLFTFFTFLMFLTILFRKSILAILAFIVWYFIENIIKLIIALKELQELNITDFFPLNAMSNLIPMPVNRLAIANNFNIGFSLEYPWLSFIVCIFWSIFFICMSYWVLKRRDV